MASERLDNGKEDCRPITEVDIGRVARELLGAHVLHESARLLQCDCPNHKSQSHRSLHVMLDKQGWHCFGCGVGGDMLQPMAAGAIGGLGLELLVALFLMPCLYVMTSRS